jgi:prolipoprotein diacylglyceryltransferase
LGDNDVNVRWHFLFESLAYIVAFRIYLHQRSTAGDFLDTSNRWSIIVAAAVGAVIGSKLLYLAEDPAQTLRRSSDLTYLLGGKTVVGAIAGGTIAVEFVKWRTGITRRTGDLFAIPLAVGIAIGRIGCFLAGIQDDTFGIATSLPWGVNLGDGIKRHPVQLYEIAAMLILALLLTRVRPPRFAEGDRFRVFVLAYFSWRLFIDFLKPGIPFDGLTVLQWTCVAAILWYAPDLWRMISAAPTAKEVLTHV